MKRIYFAYTNSHNTGKSNGGYMWEMFTASGATYIMYESIVGEQEEKIRKGNML
jgi:hypothetical protein